MDSGDHGKSGKKWSSWDHGWSREGFDLDGCLFTWLKYKMIRRLLIGVYTNEDWVLSEG